MSRGRGRGTGSSKTTEEVISEIADTVRRLESQVGQISSNQQRLESNQQRLESQVGQISSNQQRLESNQRRLESQVGQISSEIGRISSEMGRISESNLRSAVEQHRGSKWAKTYAIYSLYDLVKMATEYPLPTNKLEYFQSIAMKIGTALLVLKNDLLPIIFESLRNEFQRLTKGHYELPTLSEVTIDKYIEVVKTHYAHATSFQERLEKLKNFDNSAVDLASCSGCGLLLLLALTVHNEKDLIFREELKYILSDKFQVDCRGSVLNFDSSFPTHIEVGEIKMHLNSESYKKAIHQIYVVCGLIHYASSLLHDKKGPSTIVGFIYYRSKKFEKKEELKHQTSLKISYKLLTI